MVSGKTVLRIAQENDGSFSIQAITDGLSSMEMSALVGACFEGAHMIASMREHIDLPDDERDEIQRLLDNE